MASNKGEPDASSLFRDLPSDDPFSQLQEQQQQKQQQQQNPASEAVAKLDDKQAAVAQKQQSTSVAGDASSLFGNSGSGSADLFFSSATATAHTTSQPEAGNASAASFFQQAPNSFFDGLSQNQISDLTQSNGQESQTQQSATPASSLAQAYDPNVYGNYDYSQQQSEQLLGDGGEQQQYDESQWIQFDPNQHYYYDEQGQVHYYDPNTNQEYDMSQYDYQYDPQYADYYAQQGYDPNAYAAVDNTGTADHQQQQEQQQEQQQQQQQQYTPVQDSYDPNAYAPSVVDPQHLQSATAIAPPASNQQNYYSSNYATQPNEMNQYQQSYQPQSYASVNNTVAQVPAQVQSEQTISAQHYATDEQQEQNGVQSYAPVDAPIDQQQTFNYQPYDSTTVIATAIANDNSITDFQQQQYHQDNAYAPAELSNSNYSQIDTNFEAEDLQQYQPPPPLRDVGPPKNALSPPPPPPKQETSSLAQGPTPLPPRSAVVSPPPANTLSTTIPQRDSFDLNDVSEQSEQHYQGHEAPKEDLNDLDDLVLGGSKSEQVFDKTDLSAATDDRYGSQETADNLEQPTEQSGHVSGDPSVLTFATEDQKVPEKETMEPQITAQHGHLNLAAEPSEESKSITQSTVPEEQSLSNVSSVPDQSATYDFSYGYEPSAPSAENTHESDQAISFESHPVANYEPPETSVFDPQQTTAYEPDHTASYEPTSTYEPPQQEAANYETQQQLNNYEPQQVSGYEPQQTSSYQTYESSAGYTTQSTNACDPSSATLVAGGYESQDQSGGYDPTSTNYNTTSSPPSHAGSVRSVASPPPPMQQSYSQRANGITEQDRRYHSGSPFAGRYGNSQYPTMERSATVPPPITERMASPRPPLIPCPDRLCEGENKPKAKFCCECGRPLAGISRSTTPSAISPSTYSHNVEGFSPMSSAVFGAAAEPPSYRTALDDKKDAMVASLKQFVEGSVVIQSNLDDQEKRKRALSYIESRLMSFDSNEESKALLWRVVKSMMEHQENMLGDGGELDKSIIALVSSAADNSTSHASAGRLDELEAFLTKGDREGACQFAKDYDMWAHALVIATSVEDDLFKKTVTQFIHRELFSSDAELAPQIPGDKKALRMLYSVFNGAGANAVSEYAKTTFSSEAVYTEETLHGWQSALSLVLANRSANDQAAIQGLGDQLNLLNKSYEARLCYLLSPDVSGLDNSKMIGDDMYTDLDALYLLELYEFTSKASVQQDFKLILAWWLTELGFVKESKEYIDSIGQNIDASALDHLKLIGDVGASECEDVTSLLNRQNFDALIGAIEEKVNSQSSYYGYGGQGYSVSQTHAYTGEETTGDSLQQDGLNYGYGYGGGYIEPADATRPPAPTVPAAVTSPFGKSKSIQSPFQANVQPVSSPFGIQNRSPAGAATAVTSPFGQPTSATNDSSHGAWWAGSDANQTENQQNSYQPYQPETDASTSYQPDAYAPADTTTASASAPTENTKMSSWGDDDEDLGFGNSKSKKKSDNDNDTKTTDSTVKEKPNQIDDMKDKEKTEKTSGGGWGIFSLFGRKEKDQNTDEKKAVKANLGEENAFYFDEKEQRWVNKLNDSKPVAAALPPPPKAATPQPPSAAHPMAPPSMGLKPSSIPPPRIGSAPNVPSISGGTPPAFSTPPAGKRAAGGSRKPMRSRYVDVFKTDQA